MAFPTVQDADSKTGTQVSDATSWTGPTYPTNIAAGDLVVGFIGCDGNPTVTWPSPWIKIGDYVSGTACRLSIAYFWSAAGAETGTFTVTLSAAEQGAWRTIRVTGAHPTSAPEVGTAATGTSANPDPPNLDPAGWATEDTLWIACYGQDDGRRSQSAVPANYTNGFYDTSGGPTGAALGTARRTNTIGAENPGTFTISAAQAWVAQTLAIRPAPPTFTATLATGNATAAGTAVTATTPQAGTATLSTGTATAAGTALTASDAAGGGGGNPPSVSASTNGSDASATNSFTVTLPTAATGDYRVVGVGSSGGTIDTPAGWTLVKDATGLGVTNPVVFVFQRKKQAGDTDSVSITKGAGTQNVGWVALTVIDADSTTFTGSTPAAFGDALATATSLTMNITPANAGALVVGFVSVNSGSTAITPPTGWTEQNESVAGRIIEAASLANQPASNVSGQWTWGAGRATTGVIFTVKPGALGPVNGTATLSIGTATAAGTALTASSVNPNTALIASGSAAGSGSAVTAQAGLEEWRFFTDAADASMTPLAAGATAPTLTGAQTMNGIIRLRVQLTASVSALQVQYSVDGTNWADIPNADNSGVSNAQNKWFTWANGAGTAGGTITSQKLGGTAASGIYVESRGVALTVSGGAKTEFDLALKVRWPPPDTTIQLRLLNNATPITLGTSISLTTCTAAQRSYTIAKATPAIGGGQNREANHGPWRRVFWDGTYWWVQTLQPQTADHDAVIYRWDGAAWTSYTRTIGATSIATTSEADVKHNADVRVISGTPVMYIAAWPSGAACTVARYNLSTGAPVQTGATQVQATRPGTHNHIAIDHGGFIWVAGLNGTSGLWAKRSTNPDTNAFGTQMTVGDSVTAGDIVKILPIASDRVLVLYAHGTAIRSVELTGTGFETPQNASATADINPGDWDAALWNGAVYLVHSDVNGTGGTWRTRVYNTTTKTWAAGTDPGAAQPTQNSNADGLLVVPNGAGELWVIGTTIGTEGGQDRTITAVKYNGATWGSQTLVTPAGGRGNGDDISGPIEAANGQLPVFYLFNDCDTTGMPYTYEWHVMSVSAAVSATATLTGGSATASGSALTATAGVSALATIAASTATAAGSTVTSAGAGVGTATIASGTASATGTAATSTSGALATLSGGTSAAAGTVLTARTSYTATIAAGTAAGAGLAVTARVSYTATISSASSTATGSTITSTGTISAVATLAGGTGTAAGTGVTASAAASVGLATGAAAAAGTAVSALAGGAASAILSASTATATGLVVTARAQASATLATGTGSATGSTIAATAGLGATAAITAGSATAAGTSATIRAATLATINTGASVGSGAVLAALAGGSASAILSGASAAGSGTAVLARTAALATTTGGSATAAGSAVSASAAAAGAAAITSAQATALGVAVAASAGTLAALSSTPAAGTGTSLTTGGTQSALASIAIGSAAATGTLATAKASVAIILAAGTATAAGGSAISKAQAKAILTGGTASALGGVIVGLDARIVPIRYAAVVTGRRLGGSVVGSRYAGTVTGRRLSGWVD